MFLLTLTGRDNDLSALIPKVIFPAFPLFLHVAPEFFRKLLIPLPGTSECRVCAVSSRQRMASVPAVYRFHDVASICFSKAGWSMPPMALQPMVTQSQIVLFPFSVATCAAHRKPFKFQQMMMDTLPPRLALGSCPDSIQWSLRLGCEIQFALGVMSSDFLRGWGVVLKGNNCV